MGTRPCELLVGVLFRKLGNERLRRGSDRSQRHRHQGDNLAAVFQIALGDPTQARIESLLVGGDQIQDGKTQLLGDNFHLGDQGGGNATPTVGRCNKHTRHKGREIGVAAQIVDYQPGGPHDDVVFYCNQGGGNTGATKVLTKPFNPTLERIPWVQMAPFLILPGRDSWDVVEVVSQVSNLHSSFLILVSNFAYLQSG